MSTPPTDDEREALAAHKWYTTRWGDGRGGHNWKCSCGVNDWGTGKENPERYRRYETSELAALAAVEHIAAGFHRQGPITDEWEYEHLTRYSGEFESTWRPCGPNGHGTKRRRRKAGAWETVEAARDA